MPGLSLLIKPTSGACNLCCRYCFYADVAARRETPCHGIMSIETLGMTMRRAFTYAEGNVSFAFQGGEPLLAGKDFFRQVIALQRQLNTRHVDVFNAIQTNATLLDEEWMDILREGHFLVGVSLDGTPALHDLFRVDAQDTPTSQRVLSGISLLKRHHIDYNILCVITGPLAAEPEAVFSALAPHRYIQFIPCLDALDGQRTEVSLSPQAYGRFLIHTFDLYEKAWQRGKPVSIRTFDNWLGMLLGNPPESCGMSGRCGQYFVIEADGSVYPCDFYVLDALRTGSIRSDSLFRLEKSSVSEAFRRASLTLPAACSSCGYLSLCRGGCRREREPFIQGQPSVNHLCEGIRLFFDARLPRMEQMARELARAQRREPCSIR